MAGIIKDSTLNSYAKGEPIKESISKTQMQTLVCTSIRQQPKGSPPLVDPFKANIPAVISILMFSGMKVNKGGIYLRNNLDARTTVDTYGLLQNLLASP
jgi:hypothetical protein